MLFWLQIGSGDRYVAALWEIAYGLRFKSHHCGTGSTFQNLDKVWQLSTNPELRNTFLAHSLRGIPYFKELGCWVDISHGGNAQYTPDVSADHILTPQNRIRIILLKKKLNVSLVINLLWTPWSFKRVEMLEAVWNTANNQTKSSFQRHFMWAERTIGVGLCAHVN